MNKWVIASMRKSAGKTSVIVGIAAALNKKMAYIKPFGERMLYRKKTALGLRLGPDHQPLRPERRPGGHVHRL